MCGINGILSRDSETKRKISYLNKVLSHRGPDDEGFVYINTSTNCFKTFSGTDSIEQIKNTAPHISTANTDNFDLVFGHRRLSIIDLSEKGHEPMTDESGKIWITYNGEIYNYLELREELKSLGQTFRTNTDTEVIIKAYLQWGTGCFNKFNGMWAFALWDGYKKQLILSRDRFGIKPLYFINSDNLFAFSSEIKPLSILLSKNTEINKSKIPQFIIFGNLLNSESTYIKNISSLLASHYLVYKDGSYTTAKYYEIKNQNLNLSESGLRSRIDQLFSESIKLRLRSDVKVGTCLSGGFDSSSIVAYSQEYLTQPIETFSAVWNDEKCDESKYIDLVNKKFNCIENKILPSETEFEEVFKKLHYYHEIPTEGPGLYPQWYVMEIAKPKVKVLLNGQGGDEVFGGYFKIGNYLHSLIKDKRYGKVLSNFSQYVSFLKQNSLHTFIHNFFPNIYRALVQKKFSDLYNMFNDDFIKVYGIKNIENIYNPPKKFKNYINNKSYSFITSITIPSLLHYEDRSSMAHSIESRVPFLDYRIVEIGLNLQPHYLISNETSRPLFRSVVEKCLPEEIVKRKDKLGYPTPFSSWIRKELKDYITSVLNNNLNIYDYIDKDKVIKNVLRKHMAGELDFGWEIWKLLSLEEFIKLFKTQSYLTDKH
jgi:asparagine synthase (glutamine-hydrolysing)